MSNDRSSYYFLTEYARYRRSDQPLHRKKGRPRKDAEQIKYEPYIKIRNQFSLDFFIVGKKNNKYLVKHGDDDYPCWFDESSLLKHFSDKLNDEKDLKEFLIDMEVEDILRTSGDKCLVKWKGIPYLFSSEENINSIEDDIHLINKKKRTSLDRFNDSVFMDISVLNELYQNFVTAYRNHHRVLVKGAFGYHLRRIFYEFIITLLKENVNGNILIVVNDSLIQTIKCEIRASLGIEAITFIPEDRDIDLEFIIGVNNDRVNIYLTECSNHVPISLLKALPYHAILFDGSEEQMCLFKQYYCDFKGFDTRMVVIHTEEEVHVSADIVVETLTLASYSTFFVNITDYVAQFRENCIISNRRLRNKNFFDLINDRYVIEEITKNNDNNRLNITDKLLSYPKYRALCDIAHTIIGNMHSAVVLIKNEYIKSLLKEILNSVGINAIDICFSESYKEDINSTLKCNPLTIIFTSFQGGSMNTLDFSYTLVSYIILFDPLYVPFIFGPVSVIRLISDGTHEICLSADQTIKSKEELFHQILHYINESRFTIKTESCSIPRVHTSLRCVQDCGVGSLKRDSDIHRRPTNLILSIFEDETEEEDLQNMINQKCIEEAFSLLDVYCWGQWSLISRHSTILCRPSLAKTYFQIVLAYITRFIKEELPLLYHFSSAYSLSDEYLNIIESVIKKTNINKSKFFRKGKRIEKLLLVSHNVSKSDSIDTIPIYKCPFKPTEWWNDEDDKKLVFYTFKFGYMKIPHNLISSWSMNLVVDEDLLSKRLRVLTAAYRMNLNTIIHDSNKIYNAFVNTKRREWDEHEQFAIFDYIIEYGVLNIKELSSLEVLQNKTETEIREFWRKLKILSSQEITTPDIIISTKKLNMIKKSIELMNKINKISLSSIYTEVRSIFEIIKSSGFKQSLKSPYIRLKYGTLSIPKLHSIIDDILLTDIYHNNTDTTKSQKIYKSIKMPIVAGKDIYVNEIGTVKSFCNINYLYPIDFKSETYYNGLHVENTIHLNNSQDIEFSSIVKGNKAEEFRGNNPDTVWNSIINKYFPSSNIKTTGHEFFGLMSPEVLYNIQNQKNGSYDKKLYNKRYFFGSIPKNKMNNFIPFSPKNISDIEPVNYSFISVPRKKTSDFTLLNGYGLLYKDDINDILNLPSENSSQTIK